MPCSCSRIPYSAPTPRKLSSLLPRIAFPPSTEGASSCMPPRSGLRAAFAESGADREGFRQGLRELGYGEGKNTKVEWRRAVTNQQGQARADGLSNAKADVTVASGTPAADAAMRAPATIPV